MTDSLGESPQLVGQIERISTRLKQTLSRWHSNAFYTSFFVLIVCLGSWTAPRARKAGVSRVARVSTTRSGYPVSSTSRPKGEVVVRWSGYVVGAIWPPVIP